MAVRLWGFGDPIKLKLLICDKAWLMVAPCGAPRLRIVLQEEFNRPQRLHNKPAVLSEVQVMRLEGILEGEGLEFRYYEQRPGHEVFVPCGWPHQVVNRHDCVTIAVYISRPDDIMRCIMAWQFCAECYHPGQCG